MNIAEFFEEVDKLTPSEYAKVDFRDHLRSLLRIYQNLLSQLDENDRPDNWDDVIKRIEQISKTINEVVKRIYQGRHSFAYELFKELPKIIELYRFFPEGTKAYRMRKIEERDIVKCEDLFHIPLNKRGIVKNQRYSATGYPCLYLGRTIYTCWEEMSRPSLNRSFVSQFINTDSFFVLDMSCPSFKILRRKDDIENKDAYNFYISHAFKRLPLIIASMVKVKNPNDVFKPEYIIPQLIMEFLIENQYHKNSKSPSLKGVMYTSVHQNCDFSFSYNGDSRFEKSYIQNLAIPIQKPLKGKYCKGLSSLFQMTEPTCIEYEQAKSSFDLKTDTITDISSSRYPYELSVFGQLEERLSDRNKFPLQAIQ